eukprot:13496638-Ditylum_brightwellii.AAC.1
MDPDVWIHPGIADNGHEYYTLKKVMMESDLPTKKDTSLNDFFTNLKKYENEIVVPTDKMNGHCLIAIEDYIQWVNGHMKRWLYL